jgi:inhibitor of KinA sporulation pathway (predicted exonuclease)
MNYIVLDLEWNQCPQGKQYENKKLPFEIIEIGAVRLDEKLHETGRFHRLIRPKVYKEIHFMTKQIVHLTMKDLKKGMPFPQAVQEFLDWCGDEYIFCTWGNLDVYELQRNMKYYGWDNVFGGPVKFYDVQKFFSLLYEDGKERSNLKSAVELLKINEPIEYHSALNDAVYTAQVLKKIDFEQVRKNYSIDCFYIPKKRQNEIHAVFDTYSKYVSHGFAQREDMMHDREVVSTRCYKCGSRCRKKLRWFSGNNRTYHALAYCNEHGFLKGKIRVRQDIDDQYFAIKTLKLVDEKGAQAVREKQILLREKRRERRLKTETENYKRGISH